MNKEILCRPLTEIASLIQSRQVSCEDVTLGYIERAKRLKRLNAYITLDENGSLTAARQLDTEIADGNVRGPLHGIPIAVKDQFDVRGLPTTLGGNITRAIAERDATAVSRLRAAGAIILGKLNLSEYALGGNISHAYGVPRNPWDETRQAGQSSSGSGVATAASLAAATLGGDTAGSIRGPAAWCGIVGLRPTWGRVSRNGAFPMAWFMDTIGPMTKTVEDAAAIFEVIAGHDSKDPYTSQQPVTTFHPVDDLNGLKIGLVQESIEQGMAGTAQAEAVYKALEVLGFAGAEIGQASLPLFDRGGLIANSLADTEAAYTHRKWLREFPEKYDFATRRRLMASSLISGVTYVKLSRFRSLMRKDVMNELDRFDLLITPTQAEPAPPIATETGFTSKEAVMRQFFGLRGHRSPFNLSGVPALAVPCGFSENGLPLSMQLVAKPFSENLLFSVGQLYQNLTDWHEHRPSV